MVVRADNKCCRCSQEIVYTGDEIDLFENALVCDDCWLPDDGIARWSHFEYRRARIAYG